MSNDMNQDTAKINWSAPIEAVHEDGRVVGVHLGGEAENPDSAGDHYTLPSLNGDIAGIWRPDGSSWLGADPGWRIRNVAKPVATSDDLTARMEALVRKMTGYHGAGEIGDGHHASELCEEARAIVALLPDVVDARELQMAKEIAQRRDLLPVNQEAVQDKIIETLVEAIKRGRELQKGEGA